jgi:hypothetical protein
MKAPTYEYRDGGLWFCISSQYGTPAAVHAEMLEVITTILSEATDGAAYESGHLAMMYAILDALSPTAEHLTGGWESEAARREKLSQQESNND